MQQHQLISLSSAHISFNSGLTNGGIPHPHSKEYTCWLLLEFFERHKRIPGGSVPHPRFIAGGTPSRSWLLDPKQAALLGVRPGELFSRRRERAVTLQRSSPCEPVGGLDSFITQPIHNSPLKCRGRSPSMNAQRHYCGHKRAASVNTILFILKKKKFFFSPLRKLTSRW